MFQLKKGKEALTMVEGPFKGRSFKPGESYSDIPPGMAGSFAEIKKTAQVNRVNRDTLPQGVPIYQKPANPAKAAGADDSKKAADNPPAEKGRR